MTCYLIVKSDTKLVDREKFDNWYEKEHLSEARQAFMAKSAKRNKPNDVTIIFKQTSWCVLPFLTAFW